MLSVAYKEVLNQALRLKHEEQLQLIEDLVVFIRTGHASRSPHSIMELKGLGKELWVEDDVENILMTKEICGIGNFGSGYIVSLSIRSTLCHLT